MESEEVKGYIENLGSSFKYEPEHDTEHDKEYINIITPFHYPDNDLIELYLRRYQGEKYIITDLGETLRYLFSHGFDILGTSKLNNLFITFLGNSNIKLQKGKLLIVVTKDGIENALFDLLNFSMTVTYFFSQQTKID